MAVFGENLQEDQSLLVQKDAAVHKQPKEDPPSAPADSDMEGEQDPEIPGTVPISTIGESEDLVATEPQGQEDVALQESSGDRQATEYLDTMAKYEADKIA